MLNLIIRFGTRKVQRLNQLGSADLYLGRTAILFSPACRIQRQQIDFVSYVEPFHVPNLMHTLQSFKGKWEEEWEDMYSSCFEGRK